MSTHSSAERLAASEWFAGLSVLFLIVWAVVGLYWLIGLILMLVYLMFLSWVYNTLTGAKAHQEFWDSYVPPEAHRKPSGPYWERPTVFDTPKEVPAVAPSKELPPADAEYGE